MHRIRLEPDFEAWREAAREALAQGYTPEQLRFEDASVPSPLTLGMELPEPPHASPLGKPHVPKAFLDAAKIVATHRDPERWNLLYRLLFRLQSYRDLLHVEVDEDVVYLRKLEHQVRRDLHKMHAFVRFRKVEERDESDSPREHLIAWYQPDHRILPMAAKFFVERLPTVRWTIMTPDQTASWHPESKSLSYGPGVSSDAAPQVDELEKLWLSYYGSIFNPARLNPEVMRSEMPVRYWKHLPEVALLPELMQRAEARVATMVTKQSSQPTAAPYVPEEHKLPIIREALPQCKGCDLYKHAIQVVPGNGASHAALMLVGEQPGDQEDQQGEPFVGPAGRILHKALEELRIKDKDIYVTNAVKHFKFVQRGKLRLHQSPRMSEINACRPWLQAEIDAVKPRVILCLGASSAKSLLGGTFALMKERGQMKESPYAERVMATIHPSAILRARDEQGREGLYQFMKDDLALAYAAALKTAKA